VRTPFGRLLPPLIVVAIGVSPAMAQAEAPHWFSDGKRIAQGQVVPVATAGALKMQVAGSEYNIKLKCHVKDKELITNPVGGAAGTDELVEFVFSGCSGTNLGKPVCEEGVAPEILATNLPWSSALIAGPPIQDEIATGQTGEWATRCRVRNEFQTFDVFRGAVFPAVGSSVLKFASGPTELLDINEHVVTVTGKEKMSGPPGDKKITAG
jgi:hypothetical protein